MKELKIEPKIENLDSLIDFTQANLRENGFSNEVISKFAIAVEEVFVNIVSYAKSTDKITARFLTDEKSVSVSIKDKGRAFNPLLSEPPDLSLDARESQVGGLGIYMIKQLTDGISYSYKNSCNILTLTKNK